MGLAAPSGASPGDPATPPQEGPAAIKASQRLLLPLPEELHWFALKAQLGPSSGEGAVASRDDDLLTGWSCQLGKERSCFITFSFSEEAEVVALRFFAGKGSSSSEYRHHGRLKKVRIHDDRYLVYKHAGCTGPDVPGTISIVDKSGVVIDQRSAPQDIFSTRSIKGVQMIQLGHDLYVVGKDGKFKRIYTNAVLQWSEACVTGCG